MSIILFFPLSQHSLELEHSYNVHFCSLFIILGLIFTTWKNITYLDPLLPLFPALCQALEERLKQEQREEVHALKEAHRRTLDILRQQSEQELQTLRFELEDEGKAKLGKY